MTTRTITQIARWCLQQRAATQDNTFGPETDVYRIVGKIFAMVNFDSDGFITLKADPADAEVLRQQHDYIRPGYYMNKQHWITVDVVPDLPLDLVQELVADSYSLVVGSLTRTQREGLASSPAGQ